MYSVCKLKLLNYLEWEIEFKSGKDGRKFHENFSVHKHIQE